MSWIESHQKLKEEPKLFELMMQMNWSKAEAIGRLHMLWWWCVDHAEDGDLTGFNNTHLALAVELNGEEGARFVAALNRAGFVDREPFFRIHNWWKFCNRFMKQRYKDSPEKWRRIEKMYGSIGGGGQLSGPSSGERIYPDSGERIYPDPPTAPLTSNHQSMERKSTVSVPVFASADGAEQVQKSGAEQVQKPGADHESVAAHALKERKSTVSVTVSVPQATNLTNLTNQYRYDPPLHPPQGVVHLFGAEQVHNPPVFDFDSIWKDFPKKLGRSQALRHFRASVKTESDWMSIKKALANYKRHIQDKSIESRFIQHGKTWFNNWRDWVDYQDPVTEKEKRDAAVQSLFRD